MATIIVPLVDGTSKSVDTDDLIGVGAMSEAEFDATGVQQGTYFELDGPLRFYTPLTIQEFFTVFSAAQSADTLDNGRVSMGAASVTKSGALSDITGAAVLVPVGGDYIVEASATLGVTAAATAGALAQLVIDGVAVGPAYARAATAFTTNNAPEESLVIRYTATLVGGTTVKLQGGSTGTGDALFFRPMISITPT